MSPYFRERVEIRQQLEKAKEWSLLNVYQTDLPKLLVVATASRFETAITRHIEEFYREVAQHDAATAFVMNKALFRQYHTLFNWPGNTATSFMKLFGEACAANFKIELDVQDWLATSVRDFLYLGNLRNELMHRDFASYSIDLTVEEVDAKSQSAERFVSAIPKIIRAKALLPLVQEAAKRAD